MNVKELREALTDKPDDMQVILQKDPEGNGYSPLADADGDAVYIAKDAEVYSTDWSADDACMDKEEWDEVLSKPRALILHPMY